MNLLDIFLATKPGGKKIEDALADLGDKAPDVKPGIDEILGELRADLSAENLSNLIPTLKQEIKNISQGKIDPRDHAGDSV